MEAVAQAVADPTRRTILGIVRDRERSVTDIAGHFGISRPAISQHLRVLADADLVVVRRDGRRRLYRARPEGLAELREWLDGYWREALRTLKSEVEGRQAAATSEEGRDT